MKFLKNNYKPSENNKKRNLKTRFLFFAIALISIHIIAQTPTNDTCVNSTELIVTTAFSGLSYPEIANATVINEVGCNGTTAENYVDIWYHFTMPLNGHLQVNGNSTKNNFAIYDACNGNEITCWNNGNIVEGLIVGTTYKLRIFRTETNATTSSTFSQFKVLPLNTVNDTCDVSENIVVNATPSTVNFNLQGIPSNNEVGCVGTTAERYFDVWYNFIMPVNGNVAIKSSSPQNNFAIYDACNGNEIACFSKLGIAEGLIANTNYKIRVFKDLIGVMSNSSTSFDIRAVTLATNNTCSTSQNLSISQTETSIDFDLASSTQNSNPLCNTSSTDIYDLWYDFTMPIEGNVFINSTGNFNRFTVYDACNGNEIACFTNNKLIDGLTVGSNYKLRLYRVTQSAVSTSSLNFTIKVFPQAINDTCSTAETITVTQTNSTVTFDVFGANDNLEEGCSISQEQIFDVWYTFTMPVTGNIEISNGFFNNYVAIYDACSGTKLGCFQRNGVVSGLIANQTYKLRTFRRAFQATSSNAQSFSIKAIATALNDTCTTAQNITISSTELFVPFEITNAQINNEVGCVGTTTQDYGDIWYSFTMPYNGNVFVSGGVFQNRFALYDACNGTEVNCFQRSGFFHNLTSGATYKLRVFRTATDLNVSATNFNITAFQLATNDVCTTSENIDVQNNILTTVNFELGGAEVINEQGCNATLTDYTDVWYHFTMPIDGDLEISNNNSVNKLALYADCTTTQLDCFQGNNIFTGLTQGSTYKLRVFRRLLDNQNSGKSFDFLAKTTLGIAENEFVGISIFPNPVSDAVIIKNKYNLQLINVSIVDLSGRKIKSVNLKNSFEETIINVSELEPATYVLIIKSNKGQIAKKIVKY